MLQAPGAQDGRLGRGVVLCRPVSLTTGWAGAIQVQGLALMLESPGGERLEQPLSWAQEGIFPTVASVGTRPWQAGARKLHLGDWVLTSPNLQGSPPALQHGPLSGPGAKAQAGPAPIRGLLSAFPGLSQGPQLSHPLVGLRSDRLGLGGRKSWPEGVPPAAGGHSWSLGPHVPRTGFQGTI